MSTWNVEWTRLMAAVLVSAMGLSLTPAALADGLIRIDPQGPANPYAMGGTPASSGNLVAPSFYTTPTDPYTSYLLGGGSGSTQPASPATGYGTGSNTYTLGSTTGTTSATGYGTPATSTGVYNYGTPSYGTPLQANVSYIPVGQQFVARINEYVSSQTSRVGDPVSATIDAPILVNNAEVVPAGSSVDGTVTFVSPAHRVGKHGEMEVRFMTITKPNGEKIAIDGSVVTTNGSPVLKGDTYTMDVLKGIGIAGGSTVIGAVGGTAIGGILDAAGTGAALGTAVGAAAGIGLAIARKGRQVDLPKGSRLKVKLEQPATVTAAATRY